MAKVMVSETAFWRFQCLSHMLFFLCAMVFISTASFLTTRSQECLFQPTVCEADPNDPVCAAYSRAIISNVLVSLYGISLAIYSTFSLIVNATCGYGK